MLAIALLEFHPVKLPDNHHDGCGDSNNRSPIFEQTLGVSIKDCANVIQIISTFITSSYW